MWADIKCLPVNGLPHDIDGLTKYQLPFKTECRMESSKDGRPWAGFMTSRRSGFKGIRRVARCKGSPKCINDECQYLKMFNKENRVNFQNKSGEIICHSCGAAAINIECGASKVWEFDDDRQTVTVYHHGVHTCVAKPLSRLPSEDCDDAESKFRAVKKLGAKAYSSSRIIQAIEEGKTLEDVLGLASDLEPRKVNSIKAKVRESMDSSGHSFDAIGKYKATTDKLDKFLVYQAQNGRLTGGPSYVFKTSKTQLEIALEMDKDSSGSLHTEVCFADGNHKRCPGYITLTLWVRFNLDLHVDFYKCFFKMLNL